MTTLLISPPASQKKSAIGFAERAGFRQVRVTKDGSERRRFSSFALDSGRRRHEQGTLLNCPATGPQAYWRRRSPISCSTSSVLGSKFNRDRDIPVRLRNRLCSEFAWRPFRSPVEQPTSRAPAQSQKAPPDHDHHLRACLPAGGCWARIAGFRHACRQSWYRNEFREKPTLGTSEQPVDHGTLKPLIRGGTRWSTN